MSSNSSCSCSFALQERYIQKHIKLHLFLHLQLPLDIHSLNCFASAPSHKVVSNVEFYFGCNLPNAHNYSVRSVSINAKQVLDYCCLIFSKSENKKLQIQSKSKQKSNTEMLKKNNSNMLNFASFVKSLRSWELYLLLCFKGMMIWETFKKQIKNNEKKKMNGIKSKFGRRWFVHWMKVQLDDHWWLLSLCFKVKDTEVLKECSEN